MGYRDYTGCGGGGGGFPIYPYGVTQVRDLLDQANAIIGFAVVQDFRMSNWGASCNYRYEQHFQFFNDGRFRVVTVSYGQGCGNNQDQEATYRPLVRIDIAVKGDSNDTLALWDGAQWVDQTTEGWWLQSAPYTPEGYRYRVMDQSGSGYYIEPARGQYNDGGTGDNAWLYVTQHKVAEGDADMPAIGQCCTGTYVQGPEQFINGEAVPIIQQLFRQWATFSLTAFAFSLFHISINSLTSFKFPILSNQYFSSMPLQGRTSPYGSIKKFSVPASHGSTLLPPLT